MRRRCRHQLIMWMKQNAVIIIFTKYTKFNQTLLWFMVAIQFIQLALRFNLLHERTRNAFAFECEMGAEPNASLAHFFLSHYHQLTARYVYCSARRTHTYTRTSAVSSQHQSNQVNETLKWFCFSSHTRDKLETSSLFVSFSLAICRVAITSNTNASRA